MLRGFWALPVCLGFLFGCSAILNPDPGRLGAPLDTGVVITDSGMADGDLRDTSIPPSDTSIPPDDTGGCTTPATCVGGLLTTCTGVSTCPLGCSTSGVARCASMVPSNLSASHWRDEVRDLEIEDLGESAVTAVDTDRCMGDSADLRVVTMNAGGEACVLEVGELRIRSGGHLYVFGRRPLIVMASEQIRIDAGGILNASAVGNTPGASGGGPSEGAGAGDDGREVERFPDGGGGGGAYCGAGGNGGNGGPAEGGKGGVARGPTFLMPLVGGSGGGHGPGEELTRGEGGAGGGAVQLSTPGTIQIDGWVLAAGGGGSPGLNRSMSDWGAGGGGGSGGAVLLEAPEITVGPDGAIVTTGGGGGAAATNAGSGEPGEDGFRYLGRAPGGASATGGTSSSGGASGGGASSGGLPGGTNVNASANGGGGGGGVGCIVHRDLSGAISDISRFSGRSSAALVQAPIMLD